MCSIIGSYNKDRFKELLKINEYRGSFSYSLTFFPNNGKANVMIKGFGKMPDDILDQFTLDGYFLGHCQAPTNGLVLDETRIHPCEFKPHNSDYSMFLLHNGIIKSTCVKKINSQLNTDYQWDTQALAESINHNGLINALNDIDGSFACVLFNKVGDWLNLFRNTPSPLFIDDDLNISSTKFEGNNVRSIDINIVYHVNLSDKEITPRYSFDNKHVPFYFHS